MRRSPGFQDFSDAELGFMSGLKAEHRRLPVGTDLFRQGDAPTHLFTAYSGWAYRYRLFGDGRRQLLGVILPGDLIGVPGAAFGRHAYAVRAATEAEFCALPVARLPELLREQEGLSMRLLWLTSHEMRMVDRLAISLGRCTADETLAAFAVDLRERLERRGMLEDGGASFSFPLSQAELSDHLGMTIVHLNRVLRKLEDQKLLIVRRGRMEILDEDRLRALSCLHETADSEPQPLL